MATLTDLTTDYRTGLTHIDVVLDNSPGWNWITTHTNQIGLSSPASSAAM